MEHPRRIIQGCLYALQAFNAKRVVICIKKKYQDLFDTLTAELTRFPGAPVTVKRVGNYYPQGWEIEMIKTGLGIKVPAGVLPAKLGIMVFNVSTIAGLWRAIKWNEPVMKRN